MLTKIQYLIYYPGDLVLEWFPMRELFSLFDEQTPTEGYLAVTLRQLTVSIRHSVSLTFADEDCPDTDCSQLITVGGV